MSSNRKGWIFCLPDGERDVLSGRDAVAHLRSRLIVHLASAWRRVAPAIFIRQKAKEQLIYAKTRSSSEMKAKPSLICKIATPGRCTSLML